MHFLLPNKGMSNQRCARSGAYMVTGVTERFAIEDVTVHPVKFDSKPPLIRSSPLPWLMLTSSMSQLLMSSRRKNSIVN